MSASIRQANQCAREGRLDEARAIAARILERHPDDIDALFLAGSIDLMAGRNESGSRQLERLLALQPGHVDALTNLGLYRFREGRDSAGAARCFEEILRLQPENREALFNLGTVRLAQNRLGEAQTLFDRVVAIDPRHVGARNNLGATCLRMGRRDLAISHYRIALDAAPHDTEILANLLNAAMAARNTGLCLELFTRTLALADPGPAVFPAYAFATLRCLWDKAEALLPEVLRRIADGRCSLSAFESVNLTLLATPGIPRATLLDIHKAAGRAIQARRSAAPVDRPIPAAFRPGERFRIAYLSPDFRSHVVSAFFRGLINHHDRDRFEVFCYSNTREEDEITAQYRAAADHFVRVSDLSDEELAGRIRADGVHILIDLAGYTQNSRTAALACRCAPIQAMYLGYPYTSGLPEVDYFICDPYLDGPENAAHFVERPLRLPQSFITFDTLSEQPIEAQPPFERNGHVTFGSMNSPYKLNRELVAVWAEVLHGVPHSRLAINHPNCDLGETRRRIVDEFAAHGIAPERLSIAWEPHPAGSHLRYYNGFDIMLDAFPQTGGTTTIDALWMGVPVVTQVGAILPERLSFSILSNVGLDLGDLIAHSRAEYVARAVALAANAERMRFLRRAIPQALKSSLLCDPLRLTRQMEQTLVGAWNERFPQCPFELVPADEHTEFVAAGGVEVATDGSLDNPASYVLIEQGSCFDPEYPFVLDWFSAGMEAIDINAGFGAWALPLAAKAQGGRILATTASARDARYLARGAAHNRLGNLCIVDGGERRLRLDAELETAGWRPPDLVRANLQPSEAAVLDDAVRLFSQASPLVMFGIRRGNAEIDTALAAPLQAWGYALFRLVPGLGLLAPWQADEALDAFALNLFACKDDRAQSLAASARLAACNEPLQHFPGIDDPDWADYLRRFPFAAPRVDAWAASSQRCSDWEAYRSALSLFARAKRADLRPAQRLVALGTSVGIFMMLAQASPSMPRLLSLARALADAGRRQQAAQVLQQLVGMAEGAAWSDEEPFLPVCAEFEAVDPGGRYREWILASVLHQFERLRTFSSFFGGPDGLPLLAKLAATGFSGAEMQRRLHLIKTRFDR